MLTWSYMGLYRSPLNIHRRRDDIVAPPLWRFDIMQRESKEDDQSRQREPEVQGRRGQKVEPTPPPKVPLLDPELEDEADNAPRQIVQGRRGRDRSCTAEDERCHEILEWRVRPTLCGEVDGDGDDGADGEESKQPRIDLTGGKHASGA